MMEEITSKNTQYVRSYRARYPEKYEEEKKRIVERARIRRAEQREKLKVKKEKVKAIITPLQKELLSRISEIEDNHLDTLTQELLEVVASY